MADLWDLSIEEIGSQVGARTISASEVVAAFLERTNQVEPLVSAYIEIYADESMARAGELDRRLAAGEDLGPLAGVPVALKDNLSFDGHRLSCASRILEGYVSPYTATAVARLLAAGAVPIGRANMDEFAMGSSCESSHFGPTRNPWDLDRVPGGSSGGPAAAVAAGSVPLALGSDTGGSIRQPAALCGLVGVKPTYGRVSRLGLVAFASSTDQVGPLSRDVRGAALTLGVIAGSDPGDSSCSREPVGDYLDAIEEGIAGVRFGVIRELEGAGLADATGREWSRTLDRLRTTGAELVEISVPSVEAATAAYHVLASCEASANLARFDGVRYGRRAPEAVDLAGLYADSRSQGFGAEVKRRILLGTLTLSSGASTAPYGRARGVLARLRSELAAAFEQVAIIATPTTPSSAFRLGEKIDDPLAMVLSDVFTTPASLAGLPAIALPAGLDDEGLPLSLQLVGPRFSEAALFQAARACEHALAFRGAPAFRSVGSERP